MHLVDVVVVDVTVSTCPDELANLKPDLLRHHVSQQRVGRDIERHTEEHVGRTLIELTTQFAVGHIELEQQVARRQSHVVYFGDVPGRDDVTARIRRAAQRVDDGRDLVDVTALSSRPRAPLVPVDRSEFTLGIGPFVPDGHAAFLQPVDVRRALQEPQKLDDHRPDVDLLGGDQREPVGEVEPHLVTEDTARAGAGPVGFVDTRGEDTVHQIQVLLHLFTIGDRNGRNDQCAVP